MNRNFSVTATFKPEQESENELLPLAEQWNIGLEVHLINSAKLVNRTYKIVKTPIITMNPFITEPKEDVPD